MAKVKKSVSRRTSTARSTGKKPAKRAKKSTRKAVVRKKAAVRKKPAVRKKAVVRKKAAGSKKTDARGKRPAGPAGRRALKKKTVAAKRLTAKQKASLLKMLLETGAHFSDQVESLKNESLQRHDSVNSVEDGTDAFDRQFALSIASSEQELLASIDDALRRLKKGKYGICEDCGDVIGMPRLKALPFVRLCINCQSESERGRARPRLFR